MTNLDRDGISKVLECEASSLHAASVVGDRPMAEFRHDNIVVVFDIGLLTPGRP